MKRFWCFVDNDRHFWCSCYIISLRWRCIWETSLTDWSCTLSSQSEFSLSECFVLWLDEAGLCLFSAPSVKSDQSGITILHAHTLKMHLHTFKHTHTRTQKKLSRPDTWGFTEAMPNLSTLQHLRRGCWLKNSNWTKRTEDNLPQSSPNDNISVLHPWWILEKLHLNDFLERI